MSDLDWSSVQVVPAFSTEADWSEDNRCRSCGALSRTCWLSIQVTQTDWCCDKCDHPFDRKDQER
jgi:hypothetical protein